MSVKRPVAIYARISLDRNDGEGVARQIADCTTLARERWPDAQIAEYVDNDISAFRAKRRPEFDRLIDDLNGAQIGAVVAYHPDRLYRRLADLEAFVAGVKAAGAQVATVRAGDVDVSTASGQMIAEILASVSKHEAARIGERVSRAKQERAAAGRPAGGGLRPFGLTRDREHLMPTEADEARAAAARIVSGQSSYLAEVKRLNAAGIWTTAGNPWSVGSFRRALCSPYMAGLRAYKGRVVANTVSPAILDRDTWDALKTISAGRPGRRPSADYLLSGVFSCGACGRPLWAWTARRNMAYRCHVTDSGRGCGRITIAMDKADDHVTSTVRGWLADPAAMAAYEAWLAGHDNPETAAELVEIERLEVAATQRWASGELTDGQHDAALVVLAERRRAIEGRAGPARPRKLPAGRLADLFDAATVPERRELIKGLCVTPIPVGLGRGDGHILPAADRIDLRPIWES